MFQSCFDSKQSQQNPETYDDVQIVGAMRDAMFKGELTSKIDLDTISNKNGLYGLGPQSQMTGELLVMDGKSYVSQVVTDSTMRVLETYETGATFFVYANVEEWKEVNLPSEIKNVKELEFFIDSVSQNQKRPFAFKLSGKVESATIHIQNLPPGSKVSSPAEAHVGQVKYGLGNEDVDILGFFSTEHKTVFTHHDSFMHLHLITKDRSKMGHLDKVRFQDMTLYLPVK
ncbi:alpha-acetolactate decarboxylase [Nonlabens spongiae]|uniref:Alpha-acetolactate decarboxylase n=2 Tax=Nonlabens spongiae TaxID=331648 RepID=A0A1W6MPC6_9FLAO|nr:alpha-acetolactate decarboxylase [Nonlabens spongiae]